MNPTGTIPYFLAAFSNRLRGAFAGRFVFELDLAESGERVSDVGLVVDREPASAARIDVRERAVREIGALRCIEFGHRANASEGASSSWR